MEPSHGSGRISHIFKMFWRKLFPRWSTIILSLVVAAVPLGLPAAGSAPLPAALPEDLLPELKRLLSSATSQSPTMVSANLDLASAEAARYSDRAGLWPSLGAGGSYDTVETSTNSGGVTSSSKTTGPQYNIYFSQAIFHWGTIKAQAEIGSIRLRMAERSYAEAYRGLASSIRTGYLALVQKKIYLKNLQANVKAAESYLSLMEARRQDGRISEGDLAAPRLAVDEARIYADKALDDYESSRRILARLAGVPDISDESVPMMIPKPTFAAETIGAYFEEMKREGLDNTLAVENLKDAIEQSALNYKIQKYRLYPNFNLSAGMDHSNLTSISGGRPSISAVTTKRLGLSANWTIFDGFATRGAKLSALAAKRASEMRLKTYKETTGESARSLEKQIGFAGRLMDLTETRNALQQAAVQKVRSDVESGVSPQTLLDTTIQNANSAEYAAAAARAEFLLRWSDYLSLLGADPVVNNLPARYLHNGK